MAGMKARDGRPGSGGARPGSGGARPGAGRKPFVGPKPLVEARHGPSIPRYEREKRDPQFIQTRLDCRELIEALNAAEEAIGNLVVSLKRKRSLENTKSTIGYARRLLEASIGKDAELPPALVEAKLLHLQLLRLISHKRKSDENH